MNLIYIQRSSARLAVIVLGCLLAAWPARIVAEDAVTVANKVKAAMLLKFTKYVEWPASSFPSRESPFVLGIIGKDPVVSEIEASLAGKPIEGRPLVVRQFSDASEARGCHMIFICLSERKRLPRALENLKGQTVLTVSDAEGFIEEGGMIHLRKEGVTIKFDINQTAVEKAGLKVSSKLLQLGRPGKGASGSAK